MRSERSGKWFSEGAWAFVLSFALCVFLLTPMINNGCIDYVFYGQRRIPSEIDTPAA